MTPIQQLMLGIGAAEKTYIDQVYSTDLWTGTGAAVSIDTGLDMTKGGLAWIKPRTSAYHHLIDTVRGKTKVLYSNATNTQDTENNAFLDSFDSNGYNLINAAANQNYFITDGMDHVGWSMRETPGFFDIVTYTGTGSSVLTLSHDLGSVPGMIIIKRLDGVASDWIVYHRSTGISNYLKLNATDAAADDTSDYLFNNVAPTATHFTIGAGHDAVNANTNNYIAYLFAGGESTAAEAVSVSFGGEDDYLSFSDSDTAPGSGAFTLEFWIKPDSSITNNSYRRIIRSGDNNATGHLALIFNSSSRRISVNYNNTTLFTSATAHTAPYDQWTHIALVREGTGAKQTKLYMNGVKIKEGELSQDLTLHAWQIGTDSTLSSSTATFNGLISNVRLVVGTAVYTSSFRPTTKPLTNITNTKFLCCNNSSTTGKTVGPTITAHADVAANTDSPFDDPAGFVFGDNKEGIIKCGSYTGNGSAAGPEINLGWEPQWIMWKNADEAQNWVMVDALRGVVSGDTDARLSPNTNAAENTSLNPLEFTSSGFKITSSDTIVNGSDDNFIYVAIRRPDGYVGKPAEAGTDVFAMDTGNDSSTIPAFDSTFPVDLGIHRKPAAAGDWTLNTRLIGKKELLINTNDAETAGDADLVFDSNNGWTQNRNNTYQSWMWKRHAGFDMVTMNNLDDAAEVGDHWIFNHSLGIKPEMIWLKRRDGAQSWKVYHKGLDGGTNPHDKLLYLNASDAEGSVDYYWGHANTLSSTHFALRRNQTPNGNYIAMLFASVDGVSKCGSYTSTGHGGSGSGGAVTVTTGFSPRFILIKNISTGSGTKADWHVFDTTRGLTSGNDDKKLILNTNAAQQGEDWIDPTSDGFTIEANIGNDLNDTSGDKYIYYAHA